MKTNKNKIKNLLLEIGCEEIPARFMSVLLKELKSKSAQELKASRISYSNIETYGTYRRLVLYVENLAPKQEDISNEVKGPPAEIAYKDGKPTPAAIGFARSAGVELSDLSKKQIGPKLYVVANVYKAGKPVASVLVDLLPKIITSMHLPISMRWGDQDFKFIRPIHWALAIYGKKIIKFDIAGVKASNFTRGHRYLNSKSQIPNADLEAFKKKLSKLGVILDQEERKKSIVAQVKKASANALIEEDLLEEVNYLVENPVVLTGSFDQKYLRLPKEVLVTSMKKNQKYFSTVSRGKLESKFVVVTDGSAKKFHKNIRAGNEKVLSARLEDARFFFVEDTKIPLTERMPKLKKIGFFEKLGNMEQKTGRIRGLALLIAKKAGLTGSKELETIERIALLCKADLTTQMVFEFPVLQGVMGREYAKLCGESKDVAEGIFEHYLPRHAGDTLPPSLSAAIVSLADKIDTLVGCFCAGYIPSGSADPYGLRRAVMGIVSICLDKKLSLRLDGLIEFSHKSYSDLLSGEEGYKDFDKIKSSIFGFISARIKNIFNEKGVKYEIIDSVLHNYNDIYDLFLRVKFLSLAIKEKWFEGVRQSGDRVARISKNSPREQVRENDLEEAAEKSLHQAYLEISRVVDQKINIGDYSGALKDLAGLTDPINVFFDKILVMHKDERLKSNRLALLKALSNLYLRIADFTKL
ncbi:MAG: glycine--tRNA ligase subunit beta [Candidatus Saganbacteria bacterium]|nr:glycine--tRNA ligase subunit beta [Candidatus Saganbacteria bacterium]